MTYQPYRSPRQNVTPRTVEAKGSCAGCLFQILMIIVLLGLIIRAVAWAF